MNDQKGDIVMKERKATTKQVTVDNSTVQDVNKETEAKEIEAKKTETKKKETKKTEAKKAETKKTVKKVSEKKEAKKATTAKKTVKKANSKINAKVLFQYSGNEIDADALLEQAKVQYVASGGAEKEIKTLELYIKPEDNAAYYVVNGVPAGKVVIFA